MIQYHFKRIRALTAFLTALMLLAVLGAAPAAASGETMLAEAEPATGENTEQAVVQVKDVDELVGAIGPNVTVELLPGRYELASAASYGKDTGNQYCRWGTASEQGYELDIIGADGLTIRGAGMGKTMLIAEDRYANVLTFNGCQDLMISGFTAGHSPEPGYCAAGVLHLANCGTITVENCGFFGCGTMGVWAMNCGSLTIIASRIYECSDSAVSADNCRNVQILVSEIDHNGWKNDMPASALFQTYGGEGFIVSGCHIHDNNADLLLGTSDIRNVSFLNTQVEYNALSSVFSLYDFPATVDGCTFHRNEIGSWYADPVYTVGYENPSLFAQDLQGKDLTAEDLNAMEIQTVRPSESEETVYPEPAEVPAGGEITVTTVDEFLAAIGPNRTIILDGTSFSLADAAGYGRENGRYYRWDACYDGPQLIISGVSNLTIRSASKDPAATTFMAVPRYADVICFQGCDNVRVSGLTLGHSEGPSDCSGAVLDYESCNGITLDSCRLYGCGTLGINAYACTDLRLTDCEIYDCSIGGVVLFTVYSASFQDCRIHDVPSPMLSMYDSYAVFWNGTVLDGNYYDVTADGDLMPVSLG